MAMPAKDLIGLKFGYLTVLERRGSSTGMTKKARWLCRCECGGQVVRESQYLRSKHRTHPRSCGCHHGNETHKLSQTRPYQIWVSMRRRCFDPQDKDWPNYGGRGITVCKRWQTEFALFWEDMRVGYSAALTLGRRDNDKGYSAANCRWETVQQQANNRRGNVRIHTPLGEMTVSEAARAFHLKPITIYKRMERGNTDLLRPVP